MDFHSKIVSIANSCPCSSLTTKFHLGHHCNCNFHWKCWKSDCPIATCHIPLLHHHPNYIENITHTGVIKQNMLTDNIQGNVHYEINPPNALILRLLSSPSQIQSPGHTEALMDGRVYLLAALLSAGLHSSVWLAQRLHPGTWFHRPVNASALHLPLCDHPPLYGLLQLPGMCHGTPAGHDAPLHQDFLEPAGPSEGEQPSGAGLSAAGAEAGLLPGSGSHPVRHLLDSSAPDELPAAVPWSWRCHAGDPLYRQVTQSSSWRFLKSVFTPGCAQNLTESGCERSSSIDLTLLFWHNHFLNCPSIYTQLFFQVVFPQ